MNIVIVKHPALRIVLIKMALKNDYSGVLLSFVPFTEIATQGLSFPRHSASLRASLRKDLCPLFPVYPLFLFFKTGFFFYTENIRNLQRFVLLEAYWTFFQ